MAALYYRKTIVRPCSGHYHIGSQQGSVELGGALSGNALSKVVAHHFVYHSPFQIAKKR